jgi:hypothetical protein
MHRPLPTGQGAALLVEALKGRAEAPKAHDEAFRQTAINTRRLRPSPALVRS